MNPLLRVLLRIIQLYSPWRFPGVCRRNKGRYSTNHGQKISRKLPEICHKVARKLQKQVARKWPEYHEKVIRQSWESHETVMTVMRQSLYSLLLYSSCKLYRHVCSCLFNEMATYVLNGLPFRQMPW